MTQPSTMTWETRFDQEIVEPMLSLKIDGESVPLTGMVTPIKDFIRNEITLAVQKREEELKKKIGEAFSSMCHVTVDGACKYWRPSAFGYVDTDSDSPLDKFFPEAVKEKLLPLLSTPSEVTK